MIRSYTHKRETAHRQVTPFPTERHDTPNVALPKLYTTFRSKGTSRVRGGRHFLTDIAGYDPPRPRETRPVVETPEGETKPERARW